MNTFASFCIAIIAFSFQSSAQESSGNIEMKAAGNEIHWMTFDEALKASEEEPKKWLIDMYTDWCGWCKRMDATTFEDSLIIQEINANYYAVKFDAEQKNDIVVGDSTYSFDPSLGRRGCHRLAVQLMQGRMSYPTYVFLNEEKQVLTAVPGYKVREDFLPIVQYMAGYDPVSNPTDYKTFMLGYESPYPRSEEE